MVIGGGEEVSGNGQRECRVVVGEVVGEVCGGGGGVDGVGGGRRVGRGALRGG